MIQAWSAYVELEATDVPDDTVDALHEDLAEHYASLGEAHNGHLSVQLSIDAGTARQAMDLALKTVTKAARAHQVPAAVTALELLTEAELDRRNDTPQVPELMGTSEIAELFGVTRQRAAQITHLADFPPAVAELKSGRVFLAEQVRAFGKRWTRASGRPRRQHAEAMPEPRQKHRSRVA